MARPTGEHSSRPKGDNGKADPDATGQTTATKDGPFMDMEIPDASGLAQANSAQLSTFTPPTQDAVPPVLPLGDPAQTRAGYMLFRHYRSRPEGRNVFIYSDNSVSEVDPNGVTTQWNQTDGDQTGIYIVACFYGGGGPYAVTDAQATLLTNAGYTIDP